MKNRGILALTAERLVESLGLPRATEIIAIHQDSVCDRYFIVVGSHEPIADVTFPCGEGRHYVQGQFLERQQSAYIMDVLGGSEHVDASVQGADTVPPTEAEVDA